MSPLCPHERSERRPTSLFGSNLDTTETAMDPDLMISFAEVGYFQNPSWNASTTAVRELEVAPYEDEEEAERLLETRKRKTSRARMFWKRRSVAPAALPNRGIVVEDGDGDGDGDGNEESDCDCATDMATVASSHLPAEPIIKRRWSTRLSETFFDFGRTVKKRTDSWSVSWRKDSVAPMPPPSAPAVHVGVTANGHSSVSPPGSGEGSRDGGDERSSEDELLNYTLPIHERGRSLHMRERVAISRLPWPPIRPKRKLRAQTAPVAVAEEQHERIQPRLSLPAQYTQRRLIPRDDDAMHRQIEERERLLSNNSRHRLLVLEREVRIAEREAGLKKGHRRLRSSEREQSRASVKLKARVAREKKKVDGEFRRWKRERGIPAVSRVLRGMRNVLGGDEGEREEVVESEERESSGGESSPSASQSSTSPFSAGSSDEQRDDNVRAARYAGLAVQQAMRPWGC
jgi:hypothetical protein